MIVEVLLFAQPREIAGRDRARIEVESGATYGDLKQTLRETIAGLDALVAVSRLAAAGEFVDDNEPIREGSEIALVPPVSGG